MFCDRAQSTLGAFTAWKMADVLKNGFPVIHVEECIVWWRSKKACKFLGYFNEDIPLCEAKCSIFVGFKDIA